MSNWRLLHSQGLPKTEQAVRSRKPISNTIWWVSLSSTFHFSILFFWMNIILWLVPSYNEIPVSLPGCRPGFGPRKSGWQMCRRRCAPQTSCWWSAGSRDMSRGGTTDCDLRNESCSSARLDCTKLKLISTVRESEFNKLDWWNFRWKHLQIKIYLSLHVRSTCTITCKNWEASRTINEAHFAIIFPMKILSNNTFFQIV